MKNEYWTDLSKQQANSQGYSALGAECCTAPTQQAGVSSNLQALTETANETYNLVTVLHGVFGIANPEKEPGTLAPSNLNGTLASLHRMLQRANGKLQEIAQHLQS